MHPNSPFYMFHPDSIGWLHRRHERGEAISHADIARLARVDRSSFADSLFQDYAARALSGELKDKRGRKPLTADRAWRVAAAASLLKEETRRVRDERKASRTKGDRTLVEPCVEAASRLGEAFAVPRGRALLNEISALKKKINAMNADSLIG